jgi:hypothetical protein
MSEPVATSAAPANEDAKPEVRQDELTTPIIDNTNHVCKWCTWKHFFCMNLLVNLQHQSVPDSLK